MTTLDDRMKFYESLEQKRLLPHVPACVRIDGKNFSKWTVGLGRPYDDRLFDMMTKLTKFLVKTTGATIGYTQSDEITLIWVTQHKDEQIYLSGKVQKMASVLASMATEHFSALVQNHMPERIGRPALFDARVWSVPNLTEAYNVLLWRQNDASKNSVSMAARYYFSHKRLHKLTGKEQQELLWQEAGVNWNDYPEHFKRGTFVLRKFETRSFNELDKSEQTDFLPKHHVRTNSNLKFERQAIKIYSLPPITKLENPITELFNKNAKIGKYDL